MNRFSLSLSTPRHSRTLIAAFAALSLLVSGFLATATEAGAESKSGVIKTKNPTKKKLATEFLQLLKNKDSKGLKRFLDPAFLLQRTNGEYLTKPQYLKNPAEVEEFRVRRIFMTRQPGVRVVRFEAWNVERINGQPVPATWIPRLSTFVQRNGAWRLIAHANFSEPVTN